MDARHEAGHDEERETSLRRAQRLIAVLLALSLPARASAEDGREAAAFPNRPIHIIVPFPAGGPSDLVARLSCAAAIALALQYLKPERDGA